MASMHFVLVVEATRTNGPEIRKCLPSDRFEVSEVRAPSDGQVVAANRLPTVAFVSTEYRRDAGYRFCRELAMAGVPVVVMDPAPTKARVTKAARFGALDVLVSPASQQSIRAHFRRVLVKAGRALPGEGEGAKLEFPEDVDTPRSRIEFVIQKAPNLLALPHAVSAVLRLCSRLDTGAGDLVAPIESDSALASSVFALVNSASMGNIQPVTDLRSAIARVGMKATANLAMAQSLFKMFERRGTTLGFDRTEYWFHSLGTACCARALAVMERVCDPDDAFLSGLLHDLGKMVVDEHLPLEYQRAVREANVRGDPVRLGERNTFETDHAFVGGRIVEAWELPTHLRRAVALHHDYARLADGTVAQRGKGALEIVRCVARANHLAKAFGFGHAGDYIVERDALALWRKAKGDGLDLAQLYSQAYGELLAFTELLQLPREELTATGDGTGGRLLLCMPEQAPDYGSLIEAFAARHGLSVVAANTLDDPPPGGPLEMAVVYAGENPETLSNLAQRLPAVALKGILITEDPQPKREGVRLNENVIAVPAMLDFYVLERCRESLAGSGAAP